MMDLPLRGSALLLLLLVLLLLLLLLLELAEVLSSAMKCC